jgi:hypothetical protein
VDNAMRRYQYLGFKLKMYKPFAEWPDFCSHFYGEPFYPLNIGKQLFTYLGGKLNEERTYALVDAHKRAPWFDAMSLAVTRALMCDLYARVDGADV